MSFRAGDSVAEQLHRDLPSVIGRRFLTWVGLRAFEHFRQNRCEFAEGFALRFDVLEGGAIPIGSHEPVLGVEPIGGHPITVVILIDPPPLTVDIIIPANRHQVAIFLDLSGPVVQEAGGIEMPGLERHLCHGGIYAETGNSRVDLSFESDLLVLSDGE